MANRRLIATFGYKAVGSIPKILYLGHDADEAKAAMIAATDKGFFEIRVCRDIDLSWMFRHRAEPIKV
jgi:hypothetical protein